jgi:hypothetical protein
MLLLRRLFPLASLSILLMTACGGASNSEIKSEATKIDRCSDLIGSCEYYSCVEDERLSCGEKGYPIGYGLNYCTKLTAIDFPASNTNLGTKVFPGDGNVWKGEVRDCLQVEMDRFFAKNRKPSCQQLREFAFNSHPACYTQKTSFCELNVQSIVKVGLTIAPQDLVTAESQKQVKDTAAICMQQIDARIARESNFLVKLDLLKYKGIWKAVTLTPASLSQWLSRFAEDGQETTQL